MDRHVPRGLAHHIRDMAGFLRTNPRSDSELLTAFAETGDEAAFTALVSRHGQTVWAACRRVLDVDADAEDVFQATFISLARQAHRVRPDTIAGWLQRAAHHLALDARKAAHRREAAQRRLCERATSRTNDPPPDDDLRVAIQEELARLPERLRVPLALYYLEGKTQAEVGRLLGVTNRAVGGRLTRGLDELRGRLARRGMVVAAATLVAVLGHVPVAAAIPPGLIGAAAEAALAASDGGPAVLAGGLTATPAVRLAMDATRASGPGRLALYGLLVVAAAGIATGGAVCFPPSQFVAAPVPAEKPETKDLLPEGAVARIGTGRFWPEAGASDLARSADGAVLVTVDGKGKLTFWAANGRVDAQIDGPNKARWVGLSPDGTWLAAAGESEVWAWELGPDERHLRWKWSADTAGIERRAEHELASLAFTPDGKAIVCGDGWAGNTQLLDTRTGKSLRTLEGVAWSPLCFTADGKTLAASLPVPSFLKRSQVAVWDVQKGQCKIHEYPGGEGISDLDLSRDGKRLVWAGGDSTVRVCDPTTGKEVMNWPAHCFNPLLAFTPDGRTVAEFGLGQILYRDAGTGAEARRPVPIPNAMIGLGSGRGSKRTSGDGKHIAFTCGGAPATFEVATGKEFGPAGRLYDPLRSLAFSPDGRRVVSLSGWGEVRTWDAATGSLEKRLAFPRSTTVFEVRGIAPDGRVQVVHSHPPGEKWEWEKSAIWLSWWDGQTVTEKELSPPTKAPVAASLDGRMVARPGATDETEIVLSGPGGKELRRLKSTAGQVSNGLTFSADGRTLLSCVSGVVEAWDTATGRARGPLDISNWYDVPVLSADGRWVAAVVQEPAAPAVAGVPIAPFPYEAAVWEVSSGKTVRRRTLDGLPGSVAISPDGRMLAIGYADGSVVVLDVTNDRELRRFTGHRAVVRALAFSPDGRRLASGSADCTGIVWDVSGLVQKIGK